MKQGFLAIFLICVVLSGSGCSLVTVPIKTVGGLASATVSTTGDVVTAPFDAVGGRESRRARRAREKKEKEEAKQRKKEQADKPVPVGYSGGYYPPPQQVQETE